MSAERAYKMTIALLAVSMSVYHLVVAFIGAPQQFFFRSTHLLFALTLVFLLYPSLRKSSAQAEGRIRDDAGGYIGEAGTALPSWLDWVLIAASMVTIAYIWINHDHLLTRFVFVDDPTQLELVLGTIFVVIVLEATRRIIGLALPITAVIFLLYAFFIANTRPEQIIEIMYITTAAGHSASGRRALAAGAMCGCAWIA